MGSALGVAVLVLLIVALSALVAERRKVEQELNLRVISDAGTRAPGLEVALSREEFLRLWERVVQPPPEPEVDFQREWVLAAFMGEKPTGGYGIAIEEVRLEGRDIRVRVTEREPDPEDFVTMVITYPGQWVAAERPAPGTYQVIFQDGAGAERSRREVTF